MVFDPSEELGETFDKQFQNKVDDDPLYTIINMDTNDLLVN